MLRTLIIDDEKDARDAFRILIDKFVQDIEIVGEADGVKSGVQQIGELQPEVVFLDINMQDGTGFDLLDQLDEMNFHLVFVTAYDQYAIKAFKYAALDYLLKPIDLQELRKCVARIMELGTRVETEARLTYLQESLQAPLKNQLMEEFRSLLLNSQKEYKSRFAIKKTAGIFLLNATDIAYFFADNDLVFAVDQNRKKHVVNFRMTELESVLDPAVFFRINRSEMVNIQYIQKMEPYFGNRLVVHLKDQKEGLKTSGAKTAAFRKWVEGIS
ncbi:MAG: LytTR family DNA-binding domain-containing protein [Saprospiraceae bacterium]|nr:LytTR family DNA-binding domain-containing protein [Saprospiraceae bacterium]